MGYTDTDQLARVLRLRNPTETQGVAMQVAIDAAAFEIDSEVFGTADPSVLGFGTPYPTLAIEVNLERAVEHWTQQEAPFGVIGLGESMPVMTARDPWDRHAAKLAPLKQSWGIG